MHSFISWRTESQGGRIFSSSSSGVSRGATECGPVLLGCFESAGNLSSNSSGLEREQSRNSSRKFGFHDLQPSWKGLPSSVGRQLSYLLDINSRQHTKCTDEVEVCQECEIPIINDQTQLL